MEIQETKNPKKYAAIVTYTIAVVFLLAGLFLPLTAGKEILALQIPEVIKAMKSGGKSEFILAHQIDFLGLGKGIMDVTAWITFFYVVVTAVALIGFIPVGLSTKKQTRTASVFAYVVETAAVLLLSVWLIVELELFAGGKVNHLDEVNFSYSLLIALGGTLLMLVILSCVNKRGTGGVKLVLLLLSSVALLMLFSWTTMIPKLVKPFTKISDVLKISPLLYGTSETVDGVTVTVSSSGIDYIAALFESKYITTLFKAAPAAKDKALIVFSLITALSVLINFFIDVISLSTNARKCGHVFNAARYGIEIASVVCLMITVAVCKLKVGLLLVVILVAVAIQLAVSVGRLCRYLLANRTPAQVAEAESRRAARARAREERIALANEEKARADDVEIRTEEKQPPMQQPVIVDSEAVSQTAAAPDVTVTQYPDNYKQTATEPVKEQYANPYALPVHKPVEQPVRQPQYVNPYAPNAAPEQYVNPYAAPSRQTVSKPVEQPVNAYATQRTPFPSYTAPSQQPAYKVNTVYQGPSDEFMRKLTNDERIEFSMTFIEKSKGDIGKVPDYIIGGDNKKFFSSVFIYLGRVRNLISDGLLNKMYKELNMLK